MNTVIIGIYFKQQHNTNMLKSFLSIIAFWVSQNIFFYKINIVVVYLLFGHISPINNKRQIERHWINMSTSVVPFDSKSTEDEDNEDNAPKRKLSRKQSIASKTEEADLKNENIFQSFLFDVWDIICYTMVKLIAPSRRCCCLRSCRGTHKHMYQRGTLICSLTLTQLLSNTY